MASEGSEREDGSETNVTQQYWWVAAHEKHGFAIDAASWYDDDSNIVRLYSELNNDLIEDIKDLNDSEDAGGWKAVKVTITVIE